MNIQQAKEEIRRTFRAYTKKKEDGSPEIPVERQRPILMIGPPGIGKTAIMRQIAEETGCGLVAYTMTHHTRQSAIGLPFISRKTYNGKEYSITEYTMSEIVASLYDYMEATGKKSGILFLDEINCVSETLSPVMLQLLQNKTFGNHALPEDWVIAAAGNPPEYNKSVRELDMVTMDRVKHMEIEADLSVWQAYAVKQNVHPAIRTYLHMCPDHFYAIENTDRGQFFVTARGWEDLSSILYAYEAEKEEIREDLFLEYLQHDEIAHSFALYYDLYCHYADESGTEDLALLLKDREDVKERSSIWCLRLSALLFHGIKAKTDLYMQQYSEASRILDLTATIPKDADLREDSVRNTFFEQKKNAVKIKAEHGLLEPAKEAAEYRVLHQMEKDLSEWMKGQGSETFAVYEKQKSRGRMEELEEPAKEIRTEIEAAYSLLEQCRNAKSSLLYLTTDLTHDENCAAFLKKNPCECYEEWKRNVEETSDL